MARTPRLRKRLVIIDPQIDFMGYADGRPYSFNYGSGVYTATLPVSGAVEDMERLAGYIDAKGAELQNITVTLDSHHVLQIFHPAYWRDVSTGKAPTGVLFPIFEADIGTKWIPFNANLVYEGIHPTESRITGLDWAKYYTAELARTGRAPLTIWPEHCLIGTVGAAIYPRLKQALDAWARKYGRTITYKVKGDCMFTEHYGGLKAEVEVASAPETMMDMDTIRMLQDDDIIDLSGEASSHCVLNTGDQIVENIGASHLAKIRIIDDAMSPVPAIPGVADFPVIAEQWKQKVVNLGARRVTTTDLLAA